LKYKYLKKGKRFLGITVSEGLYNDLVKYSEKYNVSFAHIGRDAVRYWIMTSQPPSAEESDMFLTPKRRGSPKIKF
jgi:hypothetical protein